MGKNTKKNKAAAAAAAASTSKEEAAEDPSTKEEEEEVESGTTTPALEASVESLPPPEEAKEPPVEPLEASTELAPSTGAPTEITTEPTPAATTREPLAEESNGSSSVHDIAESQEAPREEDAYVLELQEELERTRAEKDVLAAQYRGLLGKLTAMRETLGNKLKQDAEELDRREGVINELNTQTATLSETIQTLQTELQNASSENSELSLSLSELRSFNSSNQDTTLLRERELHELRANLESVRIEREEWEKIADTERRRAEEAEDGREYAEREWEAGRRELDKVREEGKRERERGENLQSVLEEFQSAKDHELAALVGDLKTQLKTVTDSRNEFQLRAQMAEATIGDLSSDAEKSKALEKEIKEKNLLIGKLRHETVIMNEHLTEALRRLRKNTSDTNVDRRLVTNVLIAFLVTPRADAKRFEMLSLLSSILSWTDSEREQAGLQRVGGAAPPSMGTRRVSSQAGALKRANSSNNSVVDLDQQEREAAASESFSQLFVEFLLKEAASGSSGGGSGSGNGATTPTGPLSPSLSYSNGMSSPRGQPRDRTFSFGSTFSGTRSNGGTPNQFNLSLPPANSLAEAMGGRTPPSPGGSGSPVDPECTPLKQRYDGCFIRWVEGYLDPVLTHAPGAKSSKKSSKLSESEIQGRVKNQKDEYERLCGGVWNEYRDCVQKAVESKGLSPMLKAQQQEFPYVSMDDEKSRKE